MIRAVIFDMDGVLIDTEPVWRQVEHDVFARLGIELSDSQLRQTWGMRIDEVVGHWYRSRPWNGVRPHAVSAAIIRGMVTHVEAVGEPMPGAVEAIATARGAGLRVAIASSSSHKLIEAVVSKLGIAALVDVRCSADDELLGKPDPAVFLSAARRLDVEGSECIAIEDSPLGVRSAKGAGCVCVAVRTGSNGHVDFGAADIQIDSLTQLTPALLSDLMRR